MNFLHCLTFARGSEALEFVRTLRDMSEVHLRGKVVDIGPVLVYGARIVTPDVPAELFVSIGALTLAHALGIAPVATQSQTCVSLQAELPADMDLLFTTPTAPDERATGP